METQIFSDIVQQSYTATKMIQSLNNFFLGLVKTVNSFALVALLIIAIPFVIPFIWLIMFFVRLRLEKALRTPIVINVENYAQVRHEYDLLTQLYCNVFENEELKVSHPNTFVSKLFQIDAVERIVKQRIDRTKSQLSELSPKPAPGYSALKPVLEEELWKNRARSYKYLA